MAFRRFLRGEVAPETLERVAREVARRYDEPEAAVRPLEADNWLSTPAVVNDRYFVKVITAQNSAVHRLVTTGRNLGAFSSGAAGFFEHVDSPLELAERELSATRRMRALGVNAPEPREAFEYDGLGVLVLEYLPAVRTLEEVDPETLSSVVSEIFPALARMHTSDLVHGDLRAENVLVADGEVYFIDATTVKADSVAEAQAYDVACALATVAPLLGPTRAVALAADVFDRETLRAADPFLDFVQLRPDHAFDVGTLRGELEKHLA